MPLAEAVSVGVTLVAPIFKVLLPLLVSVPPPPKVVVTVVLPLLEMVPDIVKDVKVDVPLIVMDVPLIV